MIVQHNMRNLVDGWRWNVVALWKNLLLVGGEIGDDHAKSIWEDNDNKKKGGKLLTLAHNNIDLSPQSRTNFSAVDSKLSVSVFSEAVAIVIIENKTQIFFILNYLFGFCFPHKRKICRHFFVLHKLNDNNKIIIFFF